MSCPASKHSTWLKPEDRSLLVVVCETWSRYVALAQVRAEGLDIG